MTAYAIVSSQLAILREKERTHRAETLAQQTRWMMLRYQVNPHFLFNARDGFKGTLHHTIKRWVERLPE